MQLSKKVILLLFFAMWGIFWGNEKGISILVMEIENRTGDSSIDSKTLTELVEFHLVNMKRFRVVERQKLDKVIAEQKLNYLGLTEKEVAKVGVLVGASKAVTGSLSRVGSRYLFILRMIDTSLATIDEVVELRENSLERLIDRIGEAVKQLVNPLFAKSSVPKIQEKGQQKTEAIIQEESDESTLERLIRDAKARVRGETSQMDVTSPAEEPSSDEIGKKDVSSIKQEIDLVWDEVSRNKWGILLQLGIGGEAQIYPSRWNFLGVGWGIFSLGNRLYIGYAFAFLQPWAYIMAGYQVGFFPKVERFLLGVQHGFINIVESSTLGWQVGLVNISKENMIGLQQGFFNTSGDVKGVQVGFMNIAAEVRGVQIGVFNHTRRLYGVQMGLLNISTQNGLPFMVGINIGF